MFFAFFFNFGQIISLLKPEDLSFFLCQCKIRAEKSLALKQPKVFLICYVFDNYLDVPEGSHFLKENCTHLPPPAGVLFQSPNLVF